MFLPYSDDAPREGRFPWVNALLIAINVAVYAALSGHGNYDELVYRYGFTPAEFRPVTLLTAMFMHGDLMHLLGNMWFLYLFGDAVENRCGPLKYLISYFMCGIAGSIAHYLTFPGSDVPSIGASGAIFGVMGMYLYFFPGSRIKLFYFFLFLVGSTAVRAIWVIGILFGMEVLYSEAQRTGGVESGIAHLAHAGGFVAGVIMAAVYTWTGLIPSYGEDLSAYLWGRGGRRRVNSDSRTLPQQEIEEANYRMVDDKQWEMKPDPLNQIVRLLHAGKVDEARRAWRRYAFDNQHGVLPVREQLEIALALDRNKERGVALDAYQRVIANYPNEQPYAAEANLALAGMLLSEMKESGDLREVPFVSELLRKAIETHPNDVRRKLATEWLSALRQAQL